MEFRQKALDKLRSPEELDLPVRFARPQGWLVLSVAVVVLAVAGVWAVTGTVSQKMSVPGILTHGEGSYVLQSPLAGQVVDVRAKEGDTLAAGTAVLDVRTSKGVQPVRTVAAGRVISLPAGIGAVISTGANVATFERVQKASDPLVAMLYVSPSKAASIPAGAPVELTVAAVPAHYGKLRGTVTAIGSQAQTRQQLTAFLGDDQLAETFSAKGAPVAVLVRLEPAHSASGYTWSSPPGPPQPLTSLTGVSGSVRLSAQHPLDWLLP